MSDTAFVPFIKKERNDDGTYTVYGKAAGPDLDLDRQVLNEGWLKSALPEWFAAGANVREQHSQLAAGRGIELSPEGDDWYLKTVVVDPVTCLKLEHDVLTGYSVGIKNGRILTKSARAPKGEIVGGEIVEVSLVDRPANPTCMLSIVKAADSGELEWADAELVEWDDVTKSYVPVKADAEEAPQADVNAFIRKAIEAHPVVLKAGEAEPLKAALDAICDLIAQEAAELPGDLSEIYDIETLICALRNLREFWWSEAAAGEVPEPSTEMGTDVLTQEVEVVNLATVAEIVKAAQAEDATEEDRETLAELRKALGISEPVETVEYITKAAHEEAVANAVSSATEALVKRLETVEKAAAPGGPVKSRTAQDIDLSTAREDHITKAATYDRLANEVTDRETAAGYRELARDHRDAAERLAPAKA